MKEFLVIAVCSLALLLHADGLSKKALQDLDECLAFFEAAAGQQTWMPPIGHSSALSRHEVVQTPYEADCVAVVYKGDEQDLMDCVFVHNRQFRLLERNAYVENGTNLVEYVMACPRLPNGMSIPVNNGADMLCWLAKNPFRNGNRFGAVWHKTPFRHMYLKKQE